MTSCEKSRWKKDFYPRPPRGGRRVLPPVNLAARNFYPRPPRGGRPTEWVQTLQTSFISIHALREEGDSSFSRGFCLAQNFYPRPPRGGRRYNADSKGGIEIFLSTPSARRATRMTSKRNKSVGISIHALREEGDVELCEFDQSVVISIHALREEGDCSASLAAGFGSIFLSTPSARRATDAVQVPDVRREFLSTPSARRATQEVKLCIVGYQFLSTPSARRATAKTETKSLFSNKLYNILHEFRRALIYNGSKSYPNHAK